MGFLKSYLHKIFVMQERDPKDQNQERNTKQNQRPAEEVKQQQSDPNLTELKGLTDPNEKLEPEGTDNPIKP